ncbi:hypothetical protein M3194_25745 [Paenibacillus glycanilyticus]|uniref:hypothetical protein n=1 Tax=Paenibacillus glycanilyticus TaxID=126569 RepID=UPI00203E7C9E|nr:hypothetical protein [Paenibacillus glycanilyticus]MCM3630742.1 hypothetical protein [Paenibacillus glycanilyticus]
MQRKRRNRHRKLHIGLMAVLLSAAYTTSNTGWAASNSASASGSVFSQAGTRLADDESSSHHHHAHEEHNQSATVQWSFSPKQPQAGKPAAIQLAVADAKGQPVRSFSLNHEKEIHLIAVSSDLSEFQHLHPVDDGTGHFTVDTIFPNGGAYKLFADFIPAGGSHQVADTEVEVGGKTAPAVPLVPDKQLVRMVAGTQVTLHPGQLQAGKETSLAFSFKDAATGKPAEDMEPYLGAAGHVVIISEDLTQYLHVHPKDGQTAGPEALFETEFPVPGLYKVWGQFQRHGDTFIASFTIKVGE